jgi:hypothetical protein
MNSNEKHENCLMEHEDNLTHIINQLEIGELVSCENCGNIWDGHAQCNCWQWNDILEDDNMGIALSIETDPPIDTGLTDTGLTDTGLTDTESIDSDDDFDPVIYGGDPIT